jgi:acetyl-CoA acetyltransferase
MITDGAAALVLASEGAARAARPSGGALGSVRAWARAGLSPRRMGLGPAYAIPGVLKRGGLRLDEIDLVEINEAFAAQVIACERALASDRFCREELGLEGAAGVLDRELLNVNGGAISLGHPVGASGARIALTLLMEMRRRGARLGLASLCVGGGQGMAAILEAP